MISNNVPFSKLRALLLELGFLESVVDGKYLGYYHAATDTVIPFRMYRPQDRVTSYDLASTRSQLDWRGLLSEDAFDASLRKASA